MTEVTLYTKPDCHLCDSVKQVIDHVRRTRPFRLTLRNIDDDPTDFARYHEAIPVVLLNGQEIARYRLTYSDFEAALDAAERGAT